MRKSGCAFHHFILFQKKFCMEFPTSASNKGIVIYTVYIFNQEKGCEWIPNIVVTWLEMKSLFLLTFLNRTTGHIP